MTARTRTERTDAQPLNLNGDPACPECGHSSPMRRRAFIGRFTCAHFDVIQDALADMVEECTCSDEWHSRPTSGNPS